MEQREKRVFADADVDLIREYKSVNMVAVIAFFLSLGSVVAPLNIFFGCIAAFPAIVLAISAISSINNNSDTQTGKNWAIAGLLIASFFAAFGLSWHFSRTRSLANLARNCAVEFIDHLEKGELYSAHQLMLLPNERRHPNVPFELFYGKNPAIRKGKETVQSTYPLSQIIAIIDSAEESTGNESRSDVDFEFVGVTEVFDENDWEVIILRYRMNYTEQTLKKNLPFDIMVGRFLNENGQADWKIHSVTSPDTAK